MSTLQLVKAGAAYPSAPFWEEEIYLEAVWREIGRARKAADRAFALNDLATGRAEEARYLRLNRVHRLATSALQAVGVQ